MNNKTQFVFMSDGLFEHLTKQKRTYFRSSLTSHAMRPRGKYLKEPLQAYVKT